MKINFEARFFANNDEWLYFLSQCNLQENDNEIIEEVIINVYPDDIEKIISSLPDES